jgi:hypothetical protein
MRKEYTIRLVIVFAFALSVTFVIGIISLFPSFISAMMERDAQNKIITTQNQADQANKSSELLKDLSLEKEMLNEIKVNGLGSDYFHPRIEQLISLRGDVKISSISINKNAEGLTEIVVQGFANTRQSLLAFKSRLESNKNLTVNLPVSQLAQSSNIRFSIQIKDKKL